MLLPSTDIHAWFFALLGVAMLPGVMGKSCGAKKFTHFIYKTLYDQQCARELEVSVGGESYCAVDIVNDSLDNFMGPLRFEGQIFITLSLIAVSMLVQLGGLPVPEVGKRLANFLWGIWMSTAFLQMQNERNSDWIK